MNTGITDTLTATEAAAQGLTALTTGFRKCEAEVMDGVCASLRRGGIPFALVTVSHGVREVWRAREGMIFNARCKGAKALPRD